MRSKRIRLKSGMLIVPKDFIIINKRLARKSNYAGVITERYGILPHYVIFSYDNLSELSATEEEKICREYAQKYREIENVLNREIEARFDENGTVVNKEEWHKSLRLGLFSIPERKKDEELFCGTGIIRR